MPAAPSGSRARNWIGKRKQSRAAKKAWIASSQALLAMTEPKTGDKPMPEFVALDALVGQTAAIAPDRLAVIEGERALTYDDFDELIDRVAAAMQADGLKPRDVISICALSSIEYVATFLGALRAGAAVAPLAPSSTPHDFAAMVKDAGASILFMDETTASAMGEAADAALSVSLDDSGYGRPFRAWCAAPGT